MWADFMCDHTWTEVARYIRAVHVRCVLCGAVRLVPPEEWKRYLDGETKEPEGG